MRYLNFVLLLLPILFPGLLTAQYTTVNFDLEKTYFDDNQPLPAERRLMFTGVVPTGIDMVQISVYSRQGMENNDPLYSALWRRPLNSNSNVFSLPLNYRLRPSSRYDFRIGYYRPVAKGEKADLVEQITLSLVTYVENALRIENQQLDWTPRPRKMIREMNELVDRILMDYRSRLTDPFAGLSDLVAMKLEQAEQAPLPDATARVQLINELSALLRSEIGTILRPDLSVLAEERYVDNYETESKPGSFAISAGYGGVYLSGNWDDFDYGEGPYLGLSFPLGNRAFGPRFLSNASLTLGAYLNEFEDADGNNISGPVFNRPLYTGLDYKLLQFIRFNAGAAVLQKEVSAGNGTTDNSILIRPFIGLSARINLTVGLDR